MRASKGGTLTSIFGERVVWKAIEPSLARLRRRDHRMARRPRMLAGVPVRRRVAAERRAAALAGAQVHPLRADLHALLAHVFLRMFDGGETVDVSASGFRHGYPPF